MRKAVCCPTAPVWQAARVSRVPQAADNTHAVVAASNGDMRMRSVVSRQAGTGWQTSYLPNVWPDHYCSAGPTSRSWTRASGVNDGSVLGRRLAMHLWPGVRCQARAVREDCRVSELWFSADGSQSGRIGRCEDTGRMCVRPAIQRTIFSRRKTCGLSSLPTSDQCSSGCA